jgi:hypothetical protein
VTNRAEALVYECSGVTVASELELAAPLAVGVDSAAADITFVVGPETNPPFERPSDDVVAELIVDDYPWYTFCRVGDGYVCRMTGIADFVIDADLKHVVCHPLAGGRTNVIPIVMAGTVLAFLLTMGGRCVLHGSAVEMDGQALAFVGVSGQGKSTMAAIFCADGASLVTDDVLHLDLGDGAVHCHRSGPEIRLREKAVSLAERFGDSATVRLTEDERHALAPTASPLDRIPLAGIVIPRPDRHHPSVQARRLGDAEASLWLGRYQRIEGWQDRDHLRRHFGDVGRIVASVPVFEVSVPWGPPFATDLAHQLLEATGLAGRLADLSGA